MNVKYIVVVNDLNNTLICSKQFKKYDKAFDYIKGFNLDNYKIDIYNIELG